MKFQVQPGGNVFIPGIGTLSEGETFVAPGPDYVPSRFLIPLDKEAQAALRKAKETYVAGLEQRMAELEPPRKLPAREKEALLAVPALPGAEETAAAPEAKQPPAAPPAQHAPPKRAADR